MPPSLRRRRLLRCGGVAACASLAGCATLQAELGLRTEELGHVRLANSIDESVDVDVEVHRDDALVYESTHTLAPGSEAERVQVVLDEWRENNTARSWTIEARTTQGDWRTAELDAAVGGRHDCHSVTIVAGEWPETSLLVLPGDCDEQPAGTARSRARREARR